MLTERDILILRFLNEHGGITINQAHKIFFNSAKCGKDLARKRLKRLFDIGECKYTTIPNSPSNERVYYANKPITTHTICLLDFYANLICSGCDILEYKKEFVCNNLRADALFKYKYKNVTAICFVEVVLTNQVNYAKYEELKNTNELQNNYTTFPSLIVISNKPAVYKGNKLNVKYLDYKQTCFTKTVLP